MDARKLKWLVPLCLILGGSTALAQARISFSIVSNQNGGSVYLTDPIVISGSDQADTNNTQLDHGSGSSASVDLTTGTMRANSTGSVIIAQTYGCCAVPSANLELTSRFLNDVGRNDGVLGLNRHAADYDGGSVRAG